MSQVSSIKDKALVMLGQGTPVSIVASTLGVSDSAISQFLSQEDFSQQVAELKFRNLSRQTSIDEEYLSLEEKLLEKAKKVIPMMVKPTEVIQALAVINKTVRRGASVTDPSITSQKVVSLVLPIAITQKYITNINNQVIEVQDDSGNSRSLVTAQASSLEDLAKEILPRLSDSQGSITHDSPKTISESESKETLREGQEESRRGTAETSRGQALLEYL